MIDKYYISTKELFEKKNLKNYIIYLKEKNNGSYIKYIMRKRQKIK